jgi:hypothetical protein
VFAAAIALNLRTKRFSAGFRLGVATLAFFVTAYVLLIIHVESHGITSMCGG